MEIERTDVMSVFAHDAGGTEWSGGCTDGTVLPVAEPRDGKRH